MPSRRATGGLLLTAGVVGLAALTPARIGQTAHALTLHWRLDLMIVCLAAIGAGIVLLGVRAGRPADERSSA